MSDGEKPIILTKSEIEGIVTSAVRNTLISLGLEPENHPEMQRDLIFLRELRRANDKIRDKGILFVVGGILTLLATMIIMGTKTWLH